MRQLGRMKFVVTAAALVLSAGTAIAASPAQPGAFGQVRSYNIQNWNSNGSCSSNCGSLFGVDSWGKEAARRAGDNATHNATWKGDHTESRPTTGAPT